MYPKYPKWGTCGVKKWDHSCNIFKGGWVPKFLGALKGVPKLVASNQQIGYSRIESILRNELNGLIYDL